MRTIIRARIEQALRLSAGALKSEPGERASQLLARLAKDKSPEIRRFLKSVEDGQQGPWLRPIRSPLIAGGGAVEEIVDVGAPSCDQSRGLILSEDRKTFTCFAGSAFRTWDFSTQREVRRLDLPIEWGRGAISNPPRIAVVMAQQRTLLFVDLEAAAAGVIFEGLVMETIAISADGAWAVISSVAPDHDYEVHDWGGPRILRLFDLRKKCCVRTWETHEGFVYDLALSADGSYLATVSRDKTAQLFDLRRGVMMGRWRGNWALRAVAISGDGRRLAYVSERGILTVRENNGELLGRYRCGAAEPGCLALSADGSRVVMTGDGGWVSVIDLRKKKRYGPFIGTQPYATSLAIDAKGEHAITGERGNQIVRWDLTRGRRERDTSCWISGIWASSDKAIVDADGLWLWDLATAEHVPLRAPKGCVIASAAGVWAVANWRNSGGGRIRVGKWGRPPRTLLYESSDLGRGMLSSIGFSANGKRLAAIIHPLGCRVLDLESGRTIWQRAELPIGVRPNLSPSGRYLLLCSMQGPMEIVNLETGESRHVLAPQNIGKVLFTTDDDCVLIPQGTDTALLNWRTNSLRTLFEGSPLSISEDGRWMITTLNQRKMILWKVAEQRRVATYTLDSPAQHTALSPDGRYLIADDEGGNVHILERSNWEAD